jgi:hypothetical protein
LATNPARKSRFDEITSCLEGIADRQVNQPFALLTNQLRNITGVGILSTLLLISIQSGWALSVVLASNYRYRTKANVSIYQQTGAKPGDA